MSEDRAFILRVLAACAVAGAVALGCYLLLEATRPDNGLVGFTFLLLLPAGLSAFIAYLIDPSGTAPRRRYLMVPLWQVGAATLVGAAVLHEGVVCVLMLAPLWLVSGLVGAGVTYAVRRRFNARRRLRELKQVFSIGALTLPLLLLQVEPFLPVPTATATVTRSVVIDAPPERIWPLLRGIPDVRPDEGRWTITQDLVGIPRPLGAHLVGEGIGAVRFARWERDVTFREIITQWHPGRRIGWRFVFDSPDHWRFTDRHLMPDSAYLRITDGGYTLTPVQGGRTRVSLDTRYWMRTPVNAYAQLWGELFLGDLENNLLALVKGRAEAHPAPRPRG